MKKSPSPKKAYAAAGVDVDLGNRVKSGLGKLLASTRRPEVLGSVGGFGGLFRASFPKMKKPVLVASADGVGTKLKLAFLTGKHETIGADLVNHCVNDILTLGAEPLFFLDYIGTGKLEPAVFRQIIAGLARACRQNGCALLGGETAQMPGFYAAGEYDLAGTIVGIVEEKGMLDGSRIKAGDRIIGLPSTGLHTNGYSLARHILFEQMGLKVSSTLPGMKTTVGAELLKVHKSYLPIIRKLRTQITIKGMAHITGGGLLDNLPRVLPPSLDAVIDARSWTVPPLFRLLCQEGRVDREEAYQVFNMGIGMAVCVAANDAAATARLCGGKIIGTIAKGTGKVRIQHPAS